MAPDFYEVSPEPDFDPIPIYTGVVAQVTKLDGEAGAKKRPVKLSRHQERDNAIVQAAIEAVSKEATSTSRKRSHSTHKNDTHSTPAPAAKPVKKANAFSKMMAASKKSQEWVPETVDSTKWIQLFEQSLDEIERQRPVIGRGEWASIVSRNLLESIDAMIISTVHTWSSTQTKLNALHALIEMSTAIAYAPRSKASDAVRSGPTPAFLVNKMWKITGMMSDVDIKRLGLEKAFLSKARELRQQPLVGWEGDTWKGLDDILRVLKDPGPVDFRRLYQDVDQLLSANVDCIKMGKWMKNVIQKEIASYVNAESCFETKYNSMNVLADIGNLLVEKPLGRYLGVDSGVARSIHEALADGLLRIGKLLELSEIDQILFEMRTKPEMSSLTFLQDLQWLVDPDLFPMWKPGHHFPTRYAIITMLEQYVKVKMQEKTRHYCKNDLLAKILHLRSNFRASEYFWSSSWDILDHTIELFVDNSVPLAFDCFLVKIDCLEGKLVSQGCYYGSEERRNKFRQCIDHSITRILRRASGRACIETKLNALKALTKIGLKIVEWAAPTRPRWHNEIFADHISEDSLTDAMMSTCHSFARTDGLKCLSDQDLLDDLKELDSQRQKIPEVMEGLTAVLNVIRDPDLLISKGSRRAKAASIPEAAHIIDLTDD